MLVVVHIRRCVVVVGVVLVVVCIRHRVVVVDVVLVLVVVHIRDGRIMVMLVPVTVFMMVVVSVFVGNPDGADIGQDDLIVRAVHGRENADNGVGTAFVDVPRGMHAVDGVKGIADGEMPVGGDTGADDDFKRGGKGTPFGDLEPRIVLRARGVGKDRFVRARDAIARVVVAVGKRYRHAYVRIAFDVGIGCGGQIAERAVLQEHGIERQLVGAALDADNLRKRVGSHRQSAHDAVGERGDKDRGRDRQCDDENKQRRLQRRAAQFAPGNVTVHQFPPCGR